VSFWDSAHDVLGVLHVSTSPNAEGRRARFSLAAGGEELRPALIKSNSIEFDLAGRITVDHADVKFEATLTPRLQDRRLHARGGTAAPGRRAAAPLRGHSRSHRHLRGWRQGVRDRATGIRDRTWGYRDESVNISDYFWFFATCPDFTLVAMASCPETVSGWVDSCCGSATPRSSRASA
jgi:hypothetical protein